MEVSDEEYRRLSSTDKTAVTRDRTAHAKICPKKRKAFTKIGYRPATPSEQQQLCADGWSLINSANGNTAQAIEGAEKVLQGPFERSFDRAAEVGGWKSHPSCSEFAAAQPLEELFPADVAGFLRAKYGGTPVVGP
ncbi:MAG: hypothetical protein ACJ79R_10345 [Anaeromyxobacteraceae bacterium]